MSSSPAPAVLTFQTFLEKMRQPSAGALVRDVKTFIASLDDDASTTTTTVDGEDDDDGDDDAILRVARRVQTFLRDTEATFERHPAWRGASIAELDASGEGLEKYVMTKAHAGVFARRREDRARDERLAKRVETLKKIIEPKHLDIGECSASWALAEVELGKMNQFKAPRDKLVCVLNTCRIINNTLTTRQGSDGGADDFLPVLIYVAMRANPGRLESNLKYIQRFRGESRLVSEAAYFFTNLVSAARFLGRCAANDFTNMDVEMFERVMNEDGVLASVDLDEDEEIAETPVEAASAENPPPSTPPPQISVEEMSAALSALEGGDTSTTPREIPKNTGGGVGDYATDDDNLHTPTSRAAAPYVPWRTTEDVEAEGATQLTALDVAGNLTLSSDYKFLYAKVEDLTVGDVARLLHDYKGLALQYESLSRGVAKVLTTLDARL